MCLMRASGLESTKQKAELKAPHRQIDIPSRQSQILGEKKTVGAVEEESCCEEYINTYFIKLLSWEIFRSHK